MMDDQRRRVVRVGDLIDGVLGKVARADVAPIVRLRLAWPDIAGDWADRCSVVGLRAGVLVLQVGSGLDASLLRFEGPALLGRVRQETGGEVEVRRLDVRVAPVGDRPG